MLVFDCGGSGGRAGGEGRGGKCAEMSEKDTDS